MAHPCEPTLKRLQKLRREILTAPSTNENMKQVTALEAQIKRREAEEAEHATTDS